MSQFNKQVAEKYKYLFEGYCFNFEGLKEKTKADFVKLVKEMGGEVLDDASIIFVKESYFRKKENSSRDDLYDINYILKAVENVDATDLPKYKFSPSDNHQVTNHNPMCYEAQYIYKTDSSCHKFYYDNFFCKDCAVSEAISSKKDNSQSPDEITRSPNKEVKRSRIKHSTGHTPAASSECSSDPQQIECVHKKVQCNRNEPLSKSSKSGTDSSNDEHKLTKIKVKRTENKTVKRCISSASEESSSNEEQSKIINRKKKIRCDKKSRTINDSDETIYHANSAPIDFRVNISNGSVNSRNNSFEKNTVENGNKNIKKKNLIKNCNKSSIETSSSDEEQSKSFIGKKESSPKNESMKQNMSSQNNSKNSIEENEDSLSDSNLNEQKQKPIMVDKATGWITSLKTDIPSPIKEKVAVLPKLEPEGVTGQYDDEEVRNYFKGDKWWLPYEVPENERCTIPFCEFEPVPHPFHYRKKRFMSMIEKRILVRYLINNQKISSAKGIVTYQKLNSDGYLVHRSAETLRNCFRRTILKEIKNYNLDSYILEEFLSLD